MSKVIKKNEAEEGNKIEPKEPEKTATKVKVCSCCKVVPAHESKDICLYCIYTQQEAATD
jgi:hypothetical protein